MCHQLRDWLWKHALSGSISWAASVTEIYRILVSHPLRASFSKCLIKGQVQIQGQEQRQGQGKGKGQIGDREEGQISIASGKKSLQSFLRANPWLHHTSKTTFMIRADSSVTPFSEWFGKLTLAECSFFSRIARPIWNIGLEHLELPCSVQWVFGLGPKVIPRTCFTQSDFLMLKAQIASLKRKVHNLVYLHWSPYVSKFVAKPSMSSLPKVASPSGWVAPVFYDPVSDALLAFESRLVNRARHIAVASKSTVLAGNFLYDHGIRALQRLHESGICTVHIADKGYGFCLAGSSEMIDQFNGIAVSW